MTPLDLIGHLLAIATGVCALISAHLLGERREPEDRRSQWIARALVVIGLAAILGNLGRLLQIGLTA